MKYVFLSGGLGNQMFQYAFYKSMLNHGIKVKLSNSDFKVVNSHNGYELERVFDIKDKCSNLPKVLGYLFYFLRHRFFQSITYPEKMFSYTQDVYGSNAKLYAGCWLHESYFLDIADDIKRIYTFKNVNDRNQKLADEIRSCNSVSVHIRRGDYLNHPQYGVCKEDYYEKAFAKLEERSDKFVYFVFSDDPQWADEFMRNQGKNYRIIDINRGRDSYLDMYLMSKCKNNIIANSTFSWWAAWLNENPDKIVISPKYWFTYGDHTLNSKGWILIANR